uniref:RNA helicase aquarius-like n=1 Tax=Dermatophagoides pteronyssinus TaxID=6956 RepID=A0A6P6XSM1_DERPT|nr:RNA helicase aquarius-like [Dermatophagoides pteronyssinus]
MASLDQIRQTYLEQILATSFSTSIVGKLEIDKYLENQLWPNYNESNCDCKELIMSIVAMVNQKFREGVGSWQTFEQKPNHFPLFFRHTTRLMLNTESSLTSKEKLTLLIFLIRCFNSIEIELVRCSIQKYISMPIWSCLSLARLEFEFKKVPKLKKFWKKIEKSDQNLSESEREQVMFERKFLYNLIYDFYKCLNEIPSAEMKPKLGGKEIDLIRYCERFIEFLIDIESLLPTRRFFNAIVDDLHVITVSRLSILAQKRPNEGRLFNQLLDRLRFYVKFEIDDVTGEALTDSQISSKHFEQLTNLQKKIFKLFSDIDEYRPLFLASVASIDNRNKLLKYFSLINENRLIMLCHHLEIGLDNNEQIDKICNYFHNLKRKDILLEILVDRYQRYDSQIKSLNQMPLYPNEQIIWDENLVPSKYYSGDYCLALPKLNIQFLTLHDYLLRNFHLFRLESTYEIRQDIENAVSHLKPWKTEDGDIMFGGWSRMAIPIDSFHITEIGQAKIGEDKPSRVRGEIIVNLNVKKSIKNEWESLRKHDVCFLITVRPETKFGTQYNYNEPFIPQVGLTYVRGCEIEGMLDVQGRLVDETVANERPQFDTDYRTYRVLLDQNQFKIDNENSNQFNDIYDSFNVLVRRKPKENNFKAVLETIRDLMNTKCVVPEWLHDILLGYGDPSAAHYSNLSTNEQQFKRLDFFDTFIDYNHLVECFPTYQIQMVNNNVEEKMIDSSPPKPPFRLSIDDESKKISVMPYKILNRGPYVDEQPKWNRIRFTTKQIEAIRSGIQYGLTMVVGPPGSGKTDLAVQIINNLYHNHPDQRTLIVTHSNQALNAMFEKIISLDIDERHLLRLGHGEETLETEKDFSRYGRVNYVLKKRLELLDLVGKLAQSLNLDDDVAYTCETARYFYLYHVLSKWEAFLYEINQNQIENRTAKIIEEKFPFHKFFSNVSNLFHGQSFDEDLEIAKGCFRFLKKIFTQLDEFRAFEIMRSGSDRANYLLVREAKIIAMTCTHAALKRKELVNLMFQYDNILMEESAQILEIETFIPLLLQNPNHGHNRLKRWIMIGDHLQLPPVIKNISFQKFSNMEQSLFTRFVRLGVPTIYLDSQGRSRPSICKLYSWKYKNLKNLKHINELPEYQFPNPGFLYEYQLINVEDFNNVGESEPLPHFYQNLAEAEFVVATFMYMRLLGYPSDKITILTTYNGQKHLIRDVVEQRCSTNPFIGKPNKVTTVDKFQGQQNDYILLSLVRTKTVGHIRDVRRLIVAMSRARLGLYVFCRRNLFESCLELEQTFSLLNKHPNRLQLIPNEYYTKRFSIERINKNQQQQQQEMIIIDDMSKMVKFVFDFYTKQVQRIREQDPELFESIVNPNRKQQVDNDDDDDDEEPEQDDNQIDEDLPFEKITEKDTGLNDDEIIDESMDVDDDDENVVVVVNKDQQQQQQSVSESQESSEDKKSEHEEEEENQQPLQQEEEKD